VFFPLIIAPFSCGGDGGGDDQGGNVDFQIAISIETIIADMELSHNGLPHRVPLGWSWAEEPVMDYGSQTPQNITAMTSLGSSS